MDLFWTTNSHLQEREMNARSTLKYLSEVLSEILKKRGKIFLNINDHDFIKKK